jgi:hypothetical protein
MKKQESRRHVLLRGGAAFSIAPLIGMSAPRLARAEDVHPTPEQRARIEAALRLLGFVTWGEIEREDGGRAWEIDDARGHDGRRYELKLSANDLREISRKLED